MDELDIGILRELTHGTHVGLAWGELRFSYGPVAKRLGVTSQTVRERVEKMLHSGFLRPFPVQVNPGLLGLSMGALAINRAQHGSKRDLMEKLSLIDGVILVATHVGNHVGLTFYYEDSARLEKKIKLIARICGTNDIEFTKIPYPNCGVELSKRDWEIIAALQRARARSAKEVAQELAISTRTLKRRVRRMMDGMAISTLISSDANAIRGAIIGNLIVKYDPEADRADTDRTLLAALDSKLIYAGLWTGFSLFAVVLPSIPSAAKVLSRVKEIYGVADAKIELLEDRLENYSTLNEYVERKLVTMKE